jgi:N-formylmaleamate deformylase
MNNWADGFVRAADGVRIHYYRPGGATGGALPPLVMAHGFSDNGLCWTPVAQALAAAYDVIMLDFRGHGLSDRVSGDGIIDMTPDVAAVIEGLGLRRPIVLGHSAGAAAAAQLAAARPELVAALVLEDPPWWDQPPVADAGFPAFLESLRRLQAHPPADPIAAARSRNPGWPANELGPWIQSKIQFDLHWIDCRPIYEPFRSVASRLSCPGLLLTGDPDRGALVTAEVAQEVLQCWPGVRVEHVTGAGHNIRRDRYPAYLGALINWLHGLPKD